MLSPSAREGKNGDSLTHQTLNVWDPKTPPGEGLQLEPLVKYSSQQSKNF